MQLKQKLLLLKNNTKILNPNYLYVFNYKSTKVLNEIFISRKTGKILFLFLIGTQKSFKFPLFLNRILNAVFYKSNLTDLFYYTNFTYFSKFIYFQFFNSNFIIRMLSYILVNLIKKLITYTFYILQVFIFLLK